MRGIHAGLNLHECHACMKLSVACISSTESLGPETAHHWLERITGHPTAQLVILTALEPSPTPPDPG